MALTDITLFSGFIPTDSDLKEVKRANWIGFLVQY